MIPSRIPSGELAKLLNAAKQPIYVLDEEMTIVFLNRAAYEWLGAEPSLVGRRCVYHSVPSADPLDALAAGLCPPPCVFAGETMIATIAHTNGDGLLIERKARFVPIGFDSDDLLGVLAIVDTVDQPMVEEHENQNVPMPDADFQTLHEQVRRFRQEAAARFRADRLIGQGPAMCLARRQVEWAVLGHASVLLIGPSGSGRRHLASAIHYGTPSPSDFPATLVPLDCSLLGADLLESVLAAIARQKILGRPDASGTLLLHRVDELSTDLQLELAGLLTHRPIAWRLMATAAESLLELSRRGKFRPDLAAALSTVVIALPPLVERRDDLPLLAQLFLEDLNAEGHRQIGGFTPAALDLLDGYAWPGNLDELAQVVAEAHQRAASPEIDVADLPERIRIADHAATRARRPEETIVLDEYLAHVERELIRRALARAKNNKARAARLLGTTRPKLYRRMEQLGLE